MTEAVTDVAEHQRCMGTLVCAAGGAGERACLRGNSRSEDQKGQKQLPGHPAAGHPGRTRARARWKGAERSSCLQKKPGLMGRGGWVGGWGGPMGSLGALLSNPRR